MNDLNQKINFRYRCKINDINYDIQLFNIQQEKIKIMINTKNPYSDDYIEYSNIYSLVQFQEITRYYILFENIDEIFEDLSRTIKEKNFSIIHNGNTMTLTVKIIINKNISDVNFILDKNKTIDLSSQKENPYYFNTISSKNSDRNRLKQIYLEKSKRNIDISSIGELNTLLSDLKDRITVLEASQNNEYIQKNEIPQRRMYTNNDNFLNTDTINTGLENILIRLNRLENDNNSKDKKIELLEKKLKYYESIDNNNNIQKDNNYIKYSTPSYPNNLQRTQLSIDPFYNNQLQVKTEESFTINPRDNPYINNNDIYIQENKNRSYNNYKLKQSKSGLYNKYYNNDNASFSLYNKDRKNNNNIRSNSYYDKKILFKDNNRQYTEKDTNRSNINSNLNSTLSNYSSFKDKFAIPIVPRENLKKYVNSRIIFTKNELRLLKMKLSDGNKKIHVFFDLLYRASIDGDYEEIIKNSIKDKEKTLTLFYTYEGARFGVYIHKKLGKSFLKKKIYKEVPGTSFIVSLNNLRFFDILRNKTSKNGYYDDYLSFGRTFYLNTNGSNWLINTPRSNFLKKRCTIGNQKGEYNDFDPELLVGNKNDYHIKDVEIFHVAFEKDEEDDENDKPKNK